MLSVAGFTSLRSKRISLTEAVGKVRPFTVNCCPPAANWMSLAVAAGMSVVTGPSTTFMVWAKAVVQPRRAAAKRSMRFIVPLL